MKSKSIATQTSNSLAPSQRKAEDFSTLDSVFLAALSLGVILSILIQIYDSLSKRKQDSRDHNLNLPADPICPGCQYFSNNCYLRCAIQPTIVMTAASIDCQDYHPIHQVKRITKVSEQIHKFFGNRNTLK
jgi:hypothetical protein